jgi:hypothetical protein
MTIKEVNQHRNRFQPAPGTSSTEELPLLEKQALVDEILRGMPIKHIEYYERSQPSGKAYVVTKGWSSSPCLSRSPSMPNLTDASLSVRIS